MLHLVGQLLIQISDARNHKLKKKLILLLNNVELPEHEIWRSSLSHFSPTAALCFRKTRHNMHPLVTEEMDVSTETRINDVILTAVSTVFSFQSFLLDVASWSWDILPNIIPLPFRLPRQVSCSDSEVSTLIHISWVRVIIVTKERLLGYSQSHFVVIIISRMHYASTFITLQTTVWFPEEYALKNWSLLSCLSELLKFPRQEIREEPGAVVMMTGIVFERKTFWILTVLTGKVKSYLMWRVAKCNKVKWSERSKVNWNEVKWSAV